MEVHEFLQEAVAILGAAVAVLLASHRLRIPPVVGFLLTGVLIGPSGLSLVSDPRRVELFAEIGVIFLLFAVGLEFSLDRLRQIRRAFFLGGSLQSFLTIGAVALIAVLAGTGPPRALFLGFLAALSSTAIVLKLYAERRELDAPQGKLVLGILLFQDFLLVPMIVLTPILAGSVQASPAAIAVRFSLALLAVGAVFFIARYLMPRLLEVMVRTGIREVLVLGALFACLGFALLTERLEFSLALGAFIAGIIISESHYSPQIEAEIVPFRDVFNSLFFISIGMLLDLGYALAHPWAVLGIAAAVLALKGTATAAAVALLGYARRIVVLVAAGLAQVGEFSFVLLRVGQEHGLVDPGVYQSFIAASLLTMLATPVLVALAPRWAAWGRERGAAAAGEGLAPDAPSGHVVVVGYGLSGRNLARVLRAAGIPFVVVELAAEGVRRARAAGDPVLFGDATRRDILERAGVERASVVVFAISDLLAVLRAVTLARQLSPGVHIIVRTRMVAEIDALHRAGADEVIAEEFETSIEIFTRVLARYHVPANVIRAETRALRGERYRMLRAPSGAGDVSQAILELLAAGTTDLFRVTATSAAAGKSLLDLDLRRRSGATVIAVVRGERSQTNPPAEVVLEPGDVLVLVGSHAEVENAFGVLERGAGAEAPTP
ncbi:MAG TPA: cation:proton antiporter [Thermoanaerobaculia bacterium]